MNDEQKLLLFTHIPLGVTSLHVRAAVPNLGAPRLEGLPGGVLTDATAELDIVGYHPGAEFNFRSDTLYAVAFGPLDLPADSGAVLFDRLVEFYSRRFGMPRADEGEDSPYVVRTRFWPADHCEVGITMSLAGKRRIIGWGYQPRLNTRER